MAELLVSVRSPVEAEAALAGGAALIDVKEPANGSLGRAASEVIAAVRDTVAGRRPVSAALGELISCNGDLPAPGLAYVKWGLAGCAGRSTWPSELVEARCDLQRRDPDCGPVAVSYADYGRAQAPAPAAILDFCVRNGWRTILIDTWKKDGTTLLDWLLPAEIGEICRTCRKLGIEIALAGSLGFEEIHALLPAKPALFAVRGAVCPWRRRSATIDPALVRRLAELVAGPILEN